MSVTKTIREFLDAAPLTDGDYFAVNQPNVFNIITQQQGDTRKITVAEVGDYVIRKWQKMYVGMNADFGWKTPPSAYQLAKMRIIELTGQILEIALYQDVCDMYWVGPEANNLSSTYFWYKCDQDGTRNVNGLYMKFADWRGLFPRVAGKNGTLRTDMNVPGSTPYDGKNPGDFENQSLLTHMHGISFGYGVTAGNNFAGNSGIILAGTTGDLTWITSNSLGTGTAVNKPPTISVMKYIFYGS